MDDDLERRNESRCRSYRACWVGFWLYGLNLAATALVEIVTVLLLFSGHNPNVGHLLGIDAFDSRFEMARVWGRMIACVALVAAWPTDRSWRRRAGLLFAMAAGDLVLWGAAELVPPGVEQGLVRHAILVNSLRMALGWSRFLLLASLAADFAFHAGAPRAHELGRSARTTAIAGAAVWFAFFVVRVDWSHWPLTQRPPALDIIQLWIASLMVNTVCLVQASLLTLSAAAAAGPLLRESEREAKGFDPWAESASGAIEAR